MLYETIVNIAVGFLTGATAGLVGWIKSIPDGEDFDWIKIAPVIVIGGITGIISTVMKIDLNSAGTIIASLGVVTLVNTGWTAFCKYAKNKQWLWYKN